MEKTGAREIVDAPQGGNGTGELVNRYVQTTSEKVVSMEPDIANSGTVEEVVWVAARSEGCNEAVDIPEESEAGIRPTLLAVLQTEKLNRVLEVST